ncbi:hypothetical protein [Steroidobacter agaridevorans]|uniref:hypothetical protein n=1 Tax=Steroidobacter agaridevorans TaxID=2695856 RepID=UPI001379E89C|nr:hypothetical protein [Steroidobacter agaridevorans]
MRGRVQRRIGIAGAALCPSYEWPLLGISTEVAAMCGRIAVLIGSMVMMLPAHAFDFGAAFTDPLDHQRGIAKSRYQGDAVVTTEFEARYALDARWSGVTFAGVGRAADSSGDLHDAPNRWSGGIGARYLIARLLGLQVGVDVACGPEEWAFYIQMGNGWSF